MMELIFDEVHKKLHCGLGPQTYANGINLTGFCATGITEYLQKQIDANRSALQQCKQMPASPQRDAHVAYLEGVDAQIRGQRNALRPKADQM